MLLIGFCFIRKLKEVIRNHKSENTEFVMDYSILKPPADVANIKTLNEKAFKKKIMVPYVTVDENCIQKVAPLLKPYFLPLRKIPPIQVNDGNSKLRNILLNPVQIQSWQDLKEYIRDILIKEHNINDLQMKEVELSFEHYTVHDLIEAIIPDPAKRVTSWTFIGHILHVNLTDEKLEHKELIGQLLLKFHPSIKLVVNKINSIDSEFRNFEMEILAQTDDASKFGTIVEVKENKCTFKLDFAKVYWNSRLNTEHLRVVTSLLKDDIVYDLFAGVGPFAIPAAKKKCEVLANDLNPDAVYWLKINSDLNKTTNHLKVYNMDARDFIKDILKEHLINEWKKSAQQNLIIEKNYHVLMNLPGSAIEFLDTFVGLLNDKNPDELPKLGKMPYIHCYTFLKKDLNAKEIIPIRVESILNHKLPHNYELDMVRDVAPNKHMFRISFELPKEVLFAFKMSKRQKTS